MMQFASSQRNFRNRSTAHFTLVDKNASNYVFFFNTVAIMEIRKYLKLVLVGECYKILVQKINYGAIRCNYL